MASVKNSWTPPDRILMKSDNTILKFIGPSAFKDKDEPVFDYEYVPDEKKPKPKDGKRVPMRGSYIRELISVKFIEVLQNG